jgi:hypothetical protein
MRGLVRKRRVIALRVAKEVDAGHVDIVGRGNVTGPAAAVNDVRAGRGKE